MHVAMFRCPNSLMVSEEQGADLIDVEIISLLWVKEFYFPFRQFYLFFATSLEYFFKYGSKRGRPQRSNHLYA